MASNKTTKKAVKTKTARTVRVKPAPKVEAQGEETKGKGRPTVYTKAIAQEICLKLSEGKSLRRICADNPELPAESTVRLWSVDNVEGFYAQYTRARDMGLDAMADEILDISDTPCEGVVVTEKVGGTEKKRGDMIEHRRLQVDTRKWYLSKMAPKRYDRPTGEDKPSPNEMGEDYTLAPDEDLPDAPIL